MPVRKRYRKSNLWFLSHHSPFLTFSQDVPPHVELDLGKGIWAYTLNDLGQPDPNPRWYKIGEETRYCERGHYWGPIGVYDSTKPSHLKSLVHEVQDVTSNPDFED